MRDGQRFVVNQERMPISGAVFDVFAEVSGQEPNADDPAEGSEDADEDYNSKIHALLFLIDVDETISNA